MRSARLRLEDVNPEDFEGLKRHSYFRNFGFILMGLLY